MATRWGLCGAGKISHDFSVAMKTLPPRDHQIAVIAARSLERAKEFAKKHSIPKAYGSYEELANDPDIGGVESCERPGCTGRDKGVLLCEAEPLNICVLDRRCVPGSAAHGALARWLALPQGGEERVVREALRHELQGGERPRRRSQGKQRLPDGGCLLCPSQAIWSRCFPVHAEVRRLLAEEAVGEVKLVKAYFGSPQLHIPRSVEKELGGGALLDIGVYCLQFVLMVFNGERPESIQATGVLLDSGVDESVVVVMKFSGNRMAFCSFSIAARLPNDAVISGTKGSIKVLGPMHCPTTLVVNDKQTEYPLPEPGLPLNFTNSTGLRYEAEEVRQCLLKGLRESPQMPLAESVLLTEIMDEIRKQVGVTFSQDSQ